MASEQNRGGDMPNYVKYFYIIGGLLLTGYILIIGSSLFMPIIAALIVGLLLKPLSALLERMRMSRVVSSILSILLVFVVIAGLSMFFSAQIRNIASDMDTIEERFNGMINQVLTWAEDEFGFEPESQTDYLIDSMGSIISSGTSFFGSTLSATAGFFTGFFMFLLALFFFLYYRSFLVSFLYKVFRTENHQRLKHTLIKVEDVVRNYILGLFLVIFIVAVLNTTGLMILGLEHAVFFGVLAAVLTIIPYVGIAVGSLLPALFALITHDSLWYPLGVILIFQFIQFLEGNLITPNIVGNQVSINPLAAILGLFLAGMMFGALGMIFALPVLAIVKVTCDSIESTEPIGYLIGNPPKPEGKQRRLFPFHSLLKRKKVVIETNPEKEGED